MDAVTHCELCGREGVTTTVHHLVPRSRNKHRKIDPGPTANMCWDCHRQIHGLYSNEYLATALNSLPKLRGDPRIAAFVAWVRKQPITKKVRVRRSNDK